MAFIAFQAQAVNVTVAYQTSAEPAKVAQADNTFAKESGASVDWRKFDSGASIVRALASGDVQIGNLGSSPLAVAASQQVKWHTEFGHLNRGDMLTSEQHRCSN
ncbi:glycine betaine ABC transporter substrate-binding protein, partial [Shigella flexneri]|uniref:glycine betaine ABC transporter substrate-binding protein n=3 Tax=Shigella flexneri TaxID=623 RepID=UPI0026575802